MCFWEDDAAQYADSELEGGANEVSLSQARRNYREFGASSQPMLPHVRAPFDDEIPPVPPSPPV